MIAFAKRYVLPAVVCIVLTTAFWLGLSYVRSVRAESAQRDQLLYAVAKVVDHNIKEGKLVLPPPDAPPAK